MVRGHYPSDSPELKLAAATSRVSATKAFQLCAKENIQTHGGNGFYLGIRLLLFYKRSKVISVNIGSESRVKRKTCFSNGKNEYIRK